MKFADLPDKWRRHVGDLRAENARLRNRLKQNGVPARTGLDGLPQDWQRTIEKLRADCARYRRERNDARAELAALEAASK